MKKIDPTTVERIIAETASAEIMPRFQKLMEGDVEMKGINDPVTVADKAMEKALSARLIDYLPGSVVVGEESFAADNSIAAHFDGVPAVWIIDPIDGTRNFIAGKTEFGTMVALVRGKQTLASWIHDPNTGDTLSAEQGGGVWLRGQKMRLAGQDTSSPLVSIIGARLQKLLAKPEFVAQMTDIPPFAPGSAAAFDYGRLFTGDGLFANSTAARAAFLLYRQSKAWDHVPGLLMVAEAGGYAADLRGKPYDMGNDAHGLLLAPSHEAWMGIHQAFKPAIEMLLSL